MRVSSRQLEDVLRDHSVRLDFRRCVRDLDDFAGDKSGYILITCSPCERIKRRSTDSSTIRRQSDRGMCEVFTHAKAFGFTEKEKRAAARPARCPNAESGAGAAFGHRGQSSGLPIAAPVRRSSNERSLCRCQRHRASIMDSGPGRQRAAPWDHGEHGVAAVNGVHDCVSLCRPHGRGVDAGRSGVSDRQVTDRHSVRAPAA